MTASHVLIAIAFVGLTVLWIMLYPRLFNYRLGEKGVEFVLFGKVRVGRINFADIDEIIYYESVPWSLSDLDALISWHCGNRFSGDAIIIRKGTGIFRRVLVTPRNAWEFAEEVKRLSGCSISLRDSLLSIRKKR